MSYSEPQALIFHHTVAAGFLYCKTTIIHVHTKQARTRSTLDGISFLFFFFPSLIVKEEEEETLGPLQSIAVVNRDARQIVT